MKLPPPPRAAILVYNRDNIFFLSYLFFNLHMFYSNTLFCWIVFHIAAYQQRMIFGSSNLFSNTLNSNRTQKLYKEIVSRCPFHNFHEDLCFSPCIINNIVAYFFTCDLNTGIESGFSIWIKWHQHTLNVRRSCFVVLFLTCQNTALCSIDCLQPASLSWAMPSGRFGTTSRSHQRRNSPSWETLCADQLRYFPFCL